MLRAGCKTRGTRPPRLFGDALGVLGRTPVGRLGG